MVGRKRNKTRSVQHHLHEVEADDVRRAASDTTLPAPHLFFLLVAFQVLVKLCLLSTRHPTETAKDNSWNLRKRF